MFHKALILFATLACVTPLWAHSTDGHDRSARHGGQTAQAGDLDWELVVRPERITLYVRDHGKPGKTAGASGKLLLLVGKQKSEIALRPAGEDRLEAEGQFALAAGAKLVATVSLAGRSPVSMRFVLK